MAQYLRVVAPPTENLHTPHLQLHSRNLYPLLSSQARLLRTKFTFKYLGILFLVFAPGFNCSLLREHTHYGFNSLNMLKIALWPACGLTLMRKNCSAVVMFCRCHHIVWSDNSQLIYKFEKSAMLVAFLLSLSPVLHACGSVLLRE